MTHYLYQRLAVAYEPRVPLNRTDVHRVSDKTRQGHFSMKLHHYRKSGYMLDAEFSKIKD